MSLAIYCIEVQQLVRPQNSGLTLEAYDVITENILIVHL